MFVLVVLAMFSLAPWHVVSASEHSAHELDQAPIAGYDGHRHHDSGENRAHGPEADSSDMNADDDPAHSGQCGGYCPLCAGVTPEVAAIVPPAPEGTLRPAASPRPADTPGFDSIKPPRSSV